VTEQARPEGSPSRPVPDLGFFGTPVAPARSQLSPPPGQFDAPTNRFGWPGMAPVLPAPRTVAEPDASRLSRGTVALLFGAVALIVLGVVGGVVMAIRGQDTAEPTTVAMPAQAAAFTKVGVDSPDNPAAFLSGNAKVADAKAGVYQRGSVRAAVVGARARTALTMGDQRQVMSAFSAAIEARTDFPVVLAPVHSPRVGIFGCSQIRQIEQESAASPVSTACLSTSRGAVVAIVIVGEDYQVATQDAGTLLEAVESQGGNP
jgi:hypothetical protein